MCFIKINFKDANVWPAFKKDFKEKYKTISIPPKIK